MRTTQRAPRSCIPCSSRKIKCDKSIPCSTCVRRGRQGSCVRETVLIRGEVTAYRETPQEPTYEELKRDNTHLREEVASLRAQQTTFGLQSLAASRSDNNLLDSWQNQPYNTSFDEDQDGLDRKLWDTLAPKAPTISSDVVTWENIIMPTQPCSDRLIEYDQKWNSWVHYALEYPRFREECDDFKAAMGDGATLSQLDPLWLAVYFSVLSVGLSVPCFPKVESLDSVHNRQHYS